MGNKRIYIVAKVFDKQGCYAYRCKEENELQYIPGALELLRNKGVQIVILNDPDIYSEYAPYTYVDELKSFVQKVMKLKTA